MKKIAALLFTLFVAVAPAGAQTLVKPLNGGTGVANANANTITMNGANSVATWNATAKVVSPFWYDPNVVPSSNNYAIATGATTTDLNATVGLSLNVNDVRKQYLDSSSARWPSGLSVGFTSGVANTALDTAFSRISAGVVGVGTGAAGSTAGTLQAATITAGTKFNAPSNTPGTPVYAFGSTTAGISHNAGDDGVLISGNNAVITTWSTTGLRNGSGRPIGWSSAVLPYEAVMDTALSRVSANVVGVGNGTSGDTSGTIQMTKVKFTGFLFANIATVLAADGEMGYCSDCAIANPCAGSGTGAIAKRLNGVNVCN